MLQVEISNSCNTGWVLFIYIGLLADAYLYQVELIKLFYVLIELCFATGYLTEKGFDRVFHLLVISIFIGISFWCRINLIRLGVEYGEILEIV